MAWGTISDVSDDHDEGLEAPRAPQEKMWLDGEDAVALYRKPVELRTVLSDALVGVGCNADCIDYRNLRVEYPVSSIEGVLRWDGPSRPISRLTPLRCTTTL